MSNRTTADRRPQTADHTPDAATFRETAIGLIPADWDVIPFSKTLRSVRPKVGKVQQRDYQSCGRYPVVDQSQTHIAGYTDDASLVYEGDLPIVIFGDHTRVFKFIDFRFVCGADGVKVLVPNTDIIEPTYYYFALSSLIIPNKGYNRHYKLLQEQIIPLPPIAEQRRIATVLTAIQDAIAAQEDVIAAARAFKRSLMHRLFTYGPGREPSATKETEIGEIPAHWEVLTIDDMFDVKLGKMLSQKAKQGISPHPYLRNANVQWGYIDLSDVAEMDFDSSERNRFRLREGDILVCEGGEVGRTAIWNDELEECYYQKAIHRLRPKSGAGVLPYYFLYYMILLFLVRHVRVVEGARSTIAHLPVEKLKAVPLAMPSIDEQEQIIHRISAIDHKIAVEEDRLSALQALFKSMLHQLMTGQIRLLSDEGISDQFLTTDH